MSRIQTIYQNFVRWTVGSKVYDLRMGELANRLAFTMNLMVGTVVILYLFADAFIDIDPQIYAHIVMFFGFIMGIILFRADRIELGKSVVLLIYNVGLFMITSSEPFETGSSIYLLSMMIGATVVFAHEKVKVTMVLFILLPFVLYITSHLLDIRIFQGVNYSQQTIDLIFVVNIFIFTVSTVVVMIYYVRVIFSKNKKILEQNLQLQQTNKELDYFIYSTSHDLRAPLTSVLGLINLVEITESREELASYYGMMRGRIHKMDAFIQDIIDVIRNSRMPVTTEPVSLYPLIQGIIQELDNPMGFDTVRWEVNIEEDFILETDKKRITTILKNMISNAVKYSDSRKENSYVEINGAANGKDYRLEVRDNGIGIEPEGLHKIFDMFYRATENSKGAGLGLYIAAESARSLGGSIDVKSEENKGTCFTIILPLN